ncbi:MAG: VOC family protein [Planctomycetia bacterium]|nr:VOC family protein [Planctomycetia bacterium]
MAWYADLFGFLAIHVAGEGPANYAVLKRDGVCLHLLRRAGNTLGIGAPAQAQFRIDGGVDALFERAKAKRAVVMQEPEDQKWGHRDFMVKDPDGNIVWVGMPK